MRGPTAAGEMLGAPSLDELYRREFRGLVALAYALSGSRSAAEELVQDIWFAVWRALPSFRGDSSLKAFVARIATNRAASHVSRAVRLPPSEIVGGDIHDCAAGPEATA